MTDYAQLTDVQKKWVDRNLDKQAIIGMNADRQKRKEQLSRLVRLSGARCRWSNLPLKFETESAGGAQGIRTDPLYATVDHREPGRHDHGHDIVCSRINDAKGTLPWSVWLATTDTQTFKEWIASLQEEYVRTGKLVRPVSLQQTT